jgi:hypothetical protein
MRLEAQGKLDEALKLDETLKVRSPRLAGSTLNQRLSLAWIHAGLPGPVARLPATEPKNLLRS